MAREAAAWPDRRIAAHAAVDWRSTSLRRHLLRFMGYRLIGRIGGCREEGTGATPNAGQDDHVLQNHLAVCPS